MTQPEPGKTVQIDLTAIRRQPDLAAGRLELGTSSDVVTRRPLASARILVVGVNYSPEPSGIGHRTAIMARHLAQVAGQVTVFTGLPHHPDGHLSMVYRQQRRHQTMDGWARVIRHRHPAPESHTLLRSAAYEAGFFRAVTRTPIVDPPHVVIGILPSVGGAVAAARIARSYGARLLVVVQDLAPARSRHYSVTRAARRRLELITLREADEVAVVHESLRQRVIALGVDDDRVHVVPNPDLGVVSPLDARSARATLGWPQDEVIAVRTGNIGSDEESDMLLRTARVLAHNGSRVRLLVVGEGSRLAELRTAAMGLRSIGFVSPAGAAQYPTVLAAADILVLTERTQRPDSSTLGRFSAYLAAGRPVIAALHPLSPAAASAARAATAGAILLVAAGDPGGLARAITRLATEPHQREVMAEAARETTAGRLTTTNAGERIERLVEQMLWRPSSVPSARRTDHDT